MKKIWYFLVGHIKDDFVASHYLVTAVLLAVALTFNYLTDFEDQLLGNLEGILRFVCYFLMYGSLYGLAVCSLRYFGRHKVRLSGDFFVHAMFGIGILSLDSSVPFLQPLVNRFAAAAIHLWSYKVAINMVSFFTVFIPIIMFYKIAERNDSSLYGLRPRRFDAKPYLAMLALMLPLIIAASFTLSFQKQYPMYRVTLAHEYLGVPEWVTVLGYELAYGLDFITVELLFRGFFVVGMASFLGRGAVLSMAVIYCSLHFGKPLGEAISSIFGGFILGVVAYETKSVWGGVIVHVGIAWLMEVIAWLHKL